MPLQIVLREGAFWSVPAQESLFFVSEVRGIFNNKDLPSTSWSIQGQQGYAVCSGSLLDRPDQQSKKELLMPGVRAFG